MKTKPPSIRVGLGRSGNGLAVFVVVLLILSSGCGKSSTEQRKGASTDVAGDPLDAVAALDGAIKSGDWERAARLANEAMIASPKDPQVLTNAAIATAKAGQRVEAAQLLVDAAKVVEYSNADGRVDNAIQALLDVGRVYDAIDLLEKVLEKSPESTSHRRMLVGFLGEVQLTKDLGLHMSQLIQQRKFDIHLLLATTETNARRFSGKTIKMLLERNPSDLRPRLGEARQYLSQRDAVTAETILREIIAEHSDFTPAHELLGRVLAAQGKLTQLQEWLKIAPADTSQYAGYWIALASLAIEATDAESAVRAFGEATRRSPNDITIWTSLAEAVRTLSFVQQPANLSEHKGIDLDALADAIDRRTKDLLELRERFSEFSLEGNHSQTGTVAIARKLIDLGRNWEAEAWLAVGTTIAKGPSSELKSTRALAVKNLSEDRSWQSHRGHPELSFDLSQFALAAGLGTRKVAGVQPSSFEPDLQLAVRLAEQAEQWGLNFYGAVGAGVKGPQVPIYQTLGCGGGTIDFDRDGKHDLIFTAAGGTLRERDNEPGAVFRNLGASLIDVSLPSGFVDTGFGHGVAVGDYNDDGFADVLVLNLGRNGLYRNNGDGSFADVSELLPSRGAGDWSTSGAIVDVDRDGYNDFVVANYCDADEPLDEPCFDSDGNRINCYPWRFQAAKDQFLSGTKNGHFFDASERWNAEAQPGRGLGIVAGRLDGKTHSVYIANDATANHFYHWRDGALIESAVATGLAVDAQSIGQGSMGIASSDLDGDGDLDFYVTGFSGEYNIVYDQRTPGLWSDRTAVQNLVGSSMNTVGFGTEAVDLDNDGTDELIVTNGHIGDFGGDAPPYAQPLQLFRRSTRGYTPYGTDHFGEYFTTPHVGRALFTCDINSDGRSDLVVTHATEPVALLLNESPQDYGQITFDLVDTLQTRDAIGAVVDLEIQLESGTVSRRLFRLAGHGYLCSNRRELTIGTGNATKALNVQVTWPDGTRQEYGTLDSNAEYVLIRGDDSAFLRRSYDDSSGER